MSTSATKNNDSMHFRKAIISTMIACMSVAPIPTNASYTIIDDDLLPSSVIAERDARYNGSAGKEQDITIPFAKGSVTLGFQGRKAVDLAMTMAAAGDTFKLVGRADAQPINVTTADGNTLPISSARSNTLRQYLLRQGISAQRIVLAPDNSPNPQPNKGYPSRIVLVSSQGGSLPTDPAQRPALTPNLTPTSVPAAALASGGMPPGKSPATAPQPQAAPPAASTGSLPDQEKLIRYINEQVKTGAMDPSVALALLSNMLMHGAPSATANASVTKTAAPPAPSAPPPAEPPAPRPLHGLFAASPATARKPVWVAEKGYTLRDSIDGWAEKTGWKPVIWDASNYYEVLSTYNFEGDFPDVLKQVADGTGLNICANKRTKTIRVTDAAVRCDRDSR